MYLLSVTSIGYLLNGRKHSSICDRPSAADTHSSSGSLEADGATNVRLVAAVPAVGTALDLKCGFLRRAAAVPGIMTTCARRYTRSPNA